MLLQVGSRGTEVQAVQQKLGIKADGIFGNGTKQAIENWQIANGLHVDGVVDSETWAKMFGPEAPKAATISSTGPLPLDKLNGTIPAQVLSQIPHTAAKFNITNTLRLAHFLAQCAHESANWTATEENLNYSLDALNRVFGKYFPAGLAAQYARQPARIGARVYANRMGNGDEASGEGYTYRGRGYIQLTGKNNYRAFSNFIGKDYVSAPDGVATEQPLSSAAYYFNANNLWSICDKGPSQDVVMAVTRRVNAGLNGLPDRLQHFDKYWKSLNS